MSAIDPNHPPVPPRVDLDDPLDVGWFDPDDIYLYERSLPKNFCLGCGHVSETVKEDMRHTTNCAEKPVRSWSCWACATENWKREDCRCCGKPVDRRYG